MTDVTLELQGAVYTALRASSAVTAIVAGRVYDRVPPSPSFPYVSFGPWQAATDDYECITSYVVTMQIDVWARTVGNPEVMRLCDAVRRTLHDASLSLTDNAFLMCEHRDTRIFRDPDGQTTHGVVIFQAVVEQS